LQVANEGKLLAIVPADRADEVLAAMRAHPRGESARRIGGCVAQHPGVVVAKTALGGTRVVSLPIGEQLPRICFIAESTGIPDPLDVRVVEAYWLGNDLLDEVGSAALVDRLLNRFRGQVGGTWREAGDRATAHHTFQVYDVYPWARLLASHGRPQALHVLQQCRIRTGRVTEVDAETAIVESSPLVWDGCALAIGPSRPEKVCWSAGGRSLIERPSPGDQVTLHWDLLCDVVSDEQSARLESLERRAWAAA
jgi:hypothetical protein